VIIILFITLYWMVAVKVLMALPMVEVLEGGVWVVEWADADLVSHYTLFSFIYHINHYQYIFL
jgi:hypothetical protein